MITPELVRRFLHGTCTEEEKARLKEYFTTHPEEWDRYLTLEDWEAFEPSVQPAEGAPERWWKVIRGETKARNWKWLAAAAMVAAIAGAALWWSRTEKPIKQQIAQTDTLRRQFNGSQKTVRYFMEDGSTVDLEPGSEIRYQVPFAKGGRRIVYLNGGATFDAAKDPVHPMSVYSGVLQTLVLGTNFRIEAFDQAPFIKVLLHTGRVRVSNVDLLPGQELWYDKNTRLATVHQPKKRELTPPKNAAGVPDWYMFNNQSLAQVFDQLSEIYDVKIQYNESDLKGLYFIARFDKADSLEEIMNDIALLNGLAIHKQENTYIVRKKIH
ncbi:FecR family protein [Dinghuibacter silviterrae]|uniref:FecR family protein n=1 Tax=Dinghuibacter silviterrae TaxID=1539049 RepID=A0A4R8DTQ7_9BACT|nr:FecR domain-containing protein [Dinghuibacter silviterrae]TDX01296.1 FecR family protein [Dinghuibacter silviterrae]